MKGGRLYCTALAAADPDTLLSPTATWIDGIELRPGVDYMCSPGCTLAFGQAGTVFVAEFSEGAGGGGAMAEMLMKGMANGASQEVQDKLSTM